MCQFGHCTLAVVIISGHVAPKSAVRPITPVNSPINRVSALFGGYSYRFIGLLERHSGIQVTKSMLCIESRLSPYNVIAMRSLCFQCNAFSFPHTLKTALGVLTLKTRHFCLRSLQSTE